MRVNQESLRQALNQKFLEKRSLNSAYSVRAYARKLKISSGALSAILNGKRAVSAKLGKRLSSEMGLSPEESAAVLFGERSSVSESSISRMEESQFRAIVEWYHFAILSLAKTRGFRDNSNWIARRLGIKETQVAAALGRLSELGLLVKDRNGISRLRKTRVETTDNVKSSALRLAHLNNLRLAQRSLEEDDISIRDFSAITFTFSPSQLAQLRDQIRAFQDMAMASAEKPSNTEVYKMCISVFPLTRSK